MDIKNLINYLLGSTFSISTIILAETSSYAISLNNLINNNENIVSGNVIFSNWDLIDNFDFSLPGGGVGGINLDDIEVTSINNTNGIKYTIMNGALDASVSALELSFTYTASTINTNTLIQDASFILSEFSNTNGQINMSEFLFIEDSKIFDDDGILLTDDIIDQLIVASTQITDESKLIFQSSIPIYTSIFLDGVNANPFNVSVRMFEQNFSEKKINVPEPSTIFGLGLITVIGFGTSIKTRLPKSKKK